MGYPYFIYVLVVYTTHTHCGMHYIVRKPCLERGTVGCLSQRGRKKRQAHGGKTFTRWYAYQSDRDTGRSYTDMSSTPTTSKPDANASKAPEKPKTDDTPHIGVLEEDDEFEEFECAGEHDASNRASWGLRDLGRLGGHADGPGTFEWCRTWGCQRERRQTLGG